YGYWDTPAGREPDGMGRAANELTPTEWDPASKQPIFKVSAARIRRAADADDPSAGTQAQSEGVRR
ncbi:hypothetical protein, partial [Phytoactinopolyspora endophytica]|uniref:hypothetical protein n=1 Tax=Phytoactinopolyspora endophytica TaxID=1642495 RepID=UPI00197B1EDE